MTARPIIWSEATLKLILKHVLRSPASCTTSKRARSIPLILELESRPDYLQRFLDLWQLKSRPIVQRKDLQQLNKDIKDLTNLNIL